MQAYQLILWKQCYVLINSIGLPAELEVVVKDLWSLRLQLLRQKIDTGSNEPILYSSQETSTPESGGQGNRKGKKRLPRSKAIPNLIDSLGTCYLGMILLRLPISLGHLHRFVTAPQQSG